MSQMVKKISVFLASPGDVAEERQAATSLLTTLQYDPAFREKIALDTISWNKPGASPPMLANMTPQEAISQGMRRPSECDIVIVILWSRMGTPLPAQYEKSDGSQFNSGTEWEYEDAMTACRKDGRPHILLYRRMEKVEFTPDDPQAREKFEQYMSLQKFFNAMAGGYKQYPTALDFKDVLEHDLRHVLTDLVNEEEPKIKPVPITVTPPRRSPHNLPPRIYGELIGRKVDIDRVLRELESRYPVITIEGFAGVGKTSLAVEVGYSCVLGNEQKLETVTFDYVIWVSAKDKPMQTRWLDDVLNAIARVMEYLAITQLPKEQFEQKRLEIDLLLRTHRVLVIIDNFEIIKDRSLMRWIERIPEPSKVLITSRRRQFPMSLPVDLDGLADTEALELIRRHANSLGLNFIDTKSDEELLPLVDNTGGNPQAIVMALGIIKGGTLGLEDVIKGLQTNYRNKNINSVFHHLFSSSWKLISENARKVLSVVPLFTGASSIRRDALRAASGMSDADFDQALEQLVQFKLLQVDFKSTRYITHPMTHTFATEKLSKRKRFEEEARNRWSQYFRRFVEENIVRETPALPYWNALVSDKMDAIDAEWSSIHEVLKWADAHRKDQLLLDLVLLLVHYMDSRFLNLERVEYIKKAIKIAEAMGHKAEAALLRLDALGWTYVEEGRLEEAYEQIMKGRDVIEQHPDEMTTINDLIALSFAWRARVRIEQGESEDANRFINNALRVKCNPWITSRVNMAAGDIALKQNRSREALLFYEKAVKSIEKYGGEGHGYQIDPRIGLAHLAAGNLQEARKRFNALRANEAIPIGKLYGDYGLAMIAYKENKKDEARRLAGETRRSLSRRTTSNLLFKLTNQLFHDLEDDKERLSAYP